MEVTFRNPLKVPLALSNLSLLWSFSHHAGGDGGEVLAAEETISNEEGPTPGVGHQQHPLPQQLLRLEELSRAFTLSRLLALQTTQNDEVITTEVIAEFRMGPDETKMVRWSSHSGAGVHVSADAQDCCVMEMADTEQKSRKDL